MYRFDEGVSIVKNPTAFTVLIYIYSQEKNTHTHLSHEMSAFIFTAIVIIPTSWIPHIILPRCDLVFLKMFLRNVL